MNEFWKRSYLSDMETECEKGGTAHALVKDHDSCVISKATQFLCKEERHCVDVDSVLGAWTLSAIRSVDRSYHDISRQIIHLESSITTNSEDIEISNYWYLNGWNNLQQDIVSNWVDINWPICLQPASIIVLKIHGFLYLRLYVYGVGSFPLSVPLDKANFPLCVNQILLCELFLDFFLTLDFCFYFSATSHSALDTHWAKCEHIFISDINLFF